MAGHSKWAKVKHFKGAIDAKRSKVFGKLGKEIAVAARAGGGDPSMNPRLRQVMQKCKAANMPSDIVTRAIQRATGQIPDVIYEELMYEAFGPGGVAMLVEITTDNKNRTAGEIRSLFTKHGGHIGGSGSVKHLFQRKGHIIVARDKAGEDDLLSIALDAGADDFQTGCEAYDLYTAPEKLEAVSKALEAKNIKPDNAELAFIPNTTVPITSEETAQKILGLIQIIEDHDDVQNVYANFDIPDEIMSKAMAAA